MTPIEETEAFRKAKEFAADCAEVFERTPAGQRIWAEWRAQLEITPYVRNDSEFTLINIGKHEAIREVKRALDFYHSGMNQKTEVVTKRPE